MALIRVADQLKEGKRICQEAEEKIRSAGSGGT